MLNKPIAYRLSIYISLAVIAVFITFIGIYFLFNQRLIKENVQNKAIGLSSAVIGNVKRHVVSTQEVADNVSNQIYFYLEHGNSEEFISSLLKKYSFINAIHVNIDEKNPDILYHNFYCYSNNDSVRIFKANERLKTCVSFEKSFVDLLKNKTKDWSEPLICERNSNIVVSYYAPIMHTEPGEEPKLVGEVVCELSLLELNESINRINIGEDGIAFLLSKKGQYLTHPNKDWILTRNVNNIPDRFVKGNKLNIKDVLEKGIESFTVVYAEYYNFEKSWVYLQPIKENGWTLVFALPYNELYEPLYLPLLQMLFFSVLGILIIYLLVTYITNKQIQPLSTITEQLKKFSTASGDTKNIPANEITQVSESLNYMKSWYEKYKVTQSEEDQKSKSRKRDIIQASEIQQSFIKTNFPAFPDRTDIDLYAIYKPAKGVSGDLFDYFFIDEDNLVFTIGDVSGKGVPAAFFMSVAQTIIKNNSNEISAKSIVEAANKELYTNNQHQFFLTLFLGIFNVKTGKLLYCNAAHTAPYILKNDGSLFELAQSHGLPLGLYHDKYYEEAEISIEKGDSLVLYTDGVNELQDENMLQYGNARLEENLKNLRGLEPKEMVLKIEKSLDLFIGNSKQSDDISLLILKYKA